MNPPVAPSGESRSDITASSPRADVVVVGSANIDLIMSLPRLPTPGETVTDGTFTQTFGGKGANQAVAAARAGAGVAFLTCLGDDAYAQQQRENFERDRIDLRHTRFVSGQWSGTALILVDAEGRNSIAVAPGANDLVTTDQIDRASGLIAGARVLVVQNEIPARATRHAVEAAHRAGVTTLLNYAPVRDGSIELDAAVSLLVVNETEAAELTGMAEVTPQTAADAARRLHSRGPAVVIVTLGAAGVCVIDRGDVWTLEAMKVKPLDTTAAGDTFCGALAACLAARTPLKEAVRFASGAAALSVTRSGAQPSIPHRSEVEAFLGSR